jgi:hypothetical protein
VSSEARVNAAERCGASVASCDIAQLARRCCSAAVDGTSSYAVEVGTLHVSSSEQEIDCSYRFDAEIDERVDARPPLDAIHQLLSLFGAT